MAKQKPNPKSENIPEGAFDRGLIAWHAPHYLRYERGWFWFVAVFAVCGALAAYGYFNDAITMAVVFAILPFVLILEHMKKPAAVLVVISEYGIRFGELRIPYSRMRGFWILHQPPMVDELHLLTDSRLHPELTIQLMGNDAALLRQFLVTQITEFEGKNLGMLDSMVRILKLS